MPEPERYPLCPHTLQAARRRLPALKTHLENEFDDRLSASEIRSIMSLVEMTVCELSDEDMPVKPDNTPASGIPT